MRNNQPVTGREYVLRDGCAIISHTDMKGRIVEANEEFVAASGFTRDELIGQPHNIVRHPDMPPEAFRDLWDTIKSGRPWSGIVKNRCKNGDHYWVRATVTPTETGYISVRVKPSREEVAAAEALYRRMAQDGSIRLEGGAVVARGPAGRIKRAFGRLSIAQRLWGLLGLSGLMFLVAVLIGWQGLDNGRTSLKSVYEDRAVPLQELGQLKELMFANYTEVLLAFQHDPESKTASLHDHALSLHLDHLAKRNGEQDALWARYLERPLSEEEKALAWEFDATRATWDEQINSAVKQMQAGNYDGSIINAYLKAGREERVAAVQALDALIAHQTEAAGAAYQEAETLYQRDLWIFGGLLVFGVIMVLIPAFFTMRHLTRSLHAARDAARAIAAGDLLEPLPHAGRDELGALIDQFAIMRNKLHEVIAALQQDASRLTGAAGELTDSARDSARNTERQADAASGMAASIEELSVSIDQVDEHARDAKAVSIESAERAGQGATVIRETADNMRGIAAAVTATAESIRGLEAEANRISDIVHVIKEIADQTNLLALNAAIEAARAGEQGRGFAVVADEVRKLAERTSQATVEIGDMIGKVQHGTQRAVKEMQDGVERVHAGVEVARNAGSSVEAIRDGAGRASSAVEGISAAIKEQAVAAREIARQVERIAQGAEANHATAQQTASAAQKVADLASHLEKLAKRFRIA